MASSLVKLDVHIMFHVKSTGLNLRVDDLPRIFAYIGGIINGLGGIQMIVGGMPDHIHILTSLPPTKALSDFVRTIKADSSKWIKSIDASYSKFAWQDGYGAFSVSASILDKTENYIRNQAEHHKRRSFNDEYRALLEKYGVQYDERYAFSD